MSEQLIQNNDFAINVDILDKFTCISLGVTTIDNLLTQGKIKIPGVASLSGSIKNKKPDTLIINKNKNVVVYIEYKKPAAYNTAQKKQNAFKQEIEAAKAVKANIYITTDGTSFDWYNPLTGNKIVDEDGNEIKKPIKPKDCDQKELADFIDSVVFSLSDKNDKLLKKEDVDPTDLAVKISGILRRMSFASSKTALYTFVEVFLFKYLSDINILSGKNSFDEIYGMYSSDENSKADVLARYVDGPRKKMKELFPSGPDSTSIINGQVFHIDKNGVVEDNSDEIFYRILTEFSKYEKNNGKFINISKDFKSKLFETFMKNSDDKSDMGQFFTPLKVVNEMVNMVDVYEGMKIADPACGVGKFILEAVAGTPGLMEKYNFNNGKLNKPVDIYGFEKKMSEKDDLTTVLAKANTLIFFSDLYKRHNGNDESIKLISEQLLNETYYSSSSQLGTLQDIVQDKYDLILANPPYYQDKTISDLAKKTGLYAAKGLGIESLFVEWIIKSLKAEGTANIVIPDGLLSNDKNENLKQYILDQCNIEAIIKLPVNTFFNTPKQTYILTLKKKRKEDIGKCQKYKVFCYVCQSIGETLDVYRFDIKDNDLHEAVNKYNSWKGIKNQTELQEPFKTWFNNDSKLKLIGIEEFLPNKHWNIENWWNEKEQEVIGLRERKSLISLNNFANNIKEVANEIETVALALSGQCSNWPDKKDKEITYKEFKLTDLFKIISGDNKYDKTYCNTHPGDYPVWTATIGEPMAYVDSWDYDEPMLSFATRGKAGIAEVLSGKYNIGNNRYALKPLLADINLEYLSIILTGIFTNKAKGSGLKSITKNMVEDIEVPIPVKKDGTFDKNAQEECVDKYNKVQAIKQKLSDLLNEIIDVGVEIQ